MMKTARIFDTFYVHGVVKWSGRPLQDNSTTELQRITPSPRQSLRWCLNKVGISKPSVHRALKTAK